MRSKSPSGAAVEDLRDAEKKDSVNNYPFFSAKTSFIDASFDAAFDTIKPRETQRGFSRLF